VAARRRLTPLLAALPARVQLPTSVRLPSHRLLPSLRSAAVGVALALLGAGAYVVARETSVFAVQTIDVRGGTPVIRAEVRAALGDENGTSLLKVGGADLSSRLAALPDVASFTYDRSFPHTLRIVVRRERPVLVVRQVPGDGAFLVASSGRVLRTLPHAELSQLPRLWVTQAVPVSVGARLPSSVVGAASAAAAADDLRLPGGVRAIVASPTELTLTLGTGLQVRLGDAGDVLLKLAIARRIIHVVGGTQATGYVDVSVPERPVADSNPLVGG
jgi:cell division septal protein FtsQ